ncbi:MAG: methionine synthase [Deltaproteobacteria bacterium]|nr:methionine synthase [Deltaproteobacteria bacterium]
MGNVVFFNSINVRVPWDRIYRRLGYREHKTLIDERIRSKTDSDIKYALSFIQIMGAGKLVPLNVTADDRALLQTGEIFISRDLVKYIGDCREAILIGATAGDGIMDAIGRDIDSQNLTRGSVLDAVASEMTDETLDWLCDYFNHQLKRENKKVDRRRYSAGYGDLDLKNQDEIYRILELEKIGVSITESHMLIPEKSVTAIARIINL